MMKHIFLLICTSLISTQCFLAPNPRGENRNIDNSGLPACLGSNCCSQNRDCTRICTRWFHFSSKSVINRCRKLPYHEVQNIQDFMQNIRRPFPEDLRRTNPRTTFRLILALDYMVFIELFKNLYSKDEARRMLTWLASEDIIATELMTLKPEERRDFLYELLATAGDRDFINPVEESLAVKISFNSSFFQLLLNDTINSNLLQITHDIIKNDLCGLYGSNTRQSLCVLRIYCRTNVNRQYVHSEDLRGEIARRLNDPDFFKYINHNIYYGRSQSFVEPNLDNVICDFICVQSAMRGCDGYSIGNRQLL